IPTKVDAPNRSEPVASTDSSRAFLRPRVRDGRGKSVRLTGPPSPWAVIVRGDRASLERYQVERQAGSAPVGRWAVGVVAVGLVALFQSPLVDPVDRLAFRLGIGPNLVGFIGAG